MKSWYRNDACSCAYAAARWPDVPLVDVMAAAWAAWADMHPLDVWPEEDIRWQPAFGRVHYAGDVSRIMDHIAAMFGGDDGGQIWAAVARRLSK